MSQDIIKINLFEEWLILVLKNGDGYNKHKFVHFFLANSVRFLLKYEKNKYVIYRPSSAHIEKNCALGPWPVNNIIYCTPEICQLSNFRQVFNFCPISVAPKFYPQN